MKYAAELGGGTALDVVGPCYAFDMCLLRQL